MLKKFFNNIKIKKHNVDEHLEKKNKRDLKPEELAKHLAMKKAQLYQVFLTINML